MTSDVKNSLKVFVCDRRKISSLKITLEQLSPEERQRFAGLTSTKRQEEFLASRALLNFILIEAFGLQLSCFSKNSKGQPVLKNTPFKMSMSHSGDYIAFAFAAYINHIGVDLETKLSRTNDFTIAKRYFTEQENKWLDGLNGLETKHKGFRQLWSLKEALYKALGGDVLKPLLKNSFDLKDKKFVSEDKFKNFEFFTLSKEAYSLSVCLNEGLSGKNEPEIFGSTREVKAFEVFSDPGLKMRESAYPFVRMDSLGSKNMI